MKQKQLSPWTAASAQLLTCPFLPFNFVMQSYLPLNDRPVHRTRQARVLLGYAGIVVVATVLGAWKSAPSEMNAALLGLTFPGAGFLHWAATEQAPYALGLFSAAMALFMLAVLL